MDNYYNNNYNEPQKPPVNSNGGEDPPKNPPAFDFNPEKPLMNTANTNPPEPFKQGESDAADSKNASSEQYSPQPPRNIDSKLRPHRYIDDDHQEEALPVDGYYEYERRDSYNNYQGANQPRNAYAEPNRGQSYPYPYPNQSSSASRGYQEPRGNHYVEEPQNDYNSNNGYSQSVQYPYNQPRQDGYGYNAYPQQPFNPQAYAESNTQPSNGVPQFNVYAPENNAAYQRSAVSAGMSQNKTKANRALVIVIIILSVLLLASFGGILFYLFGNSVDSGFAKNDNSNSLIQPYTGSDELPTIPGINSFNSLNQDFDESDYSDKVKKDYKGLALNDKPSNATDSESRSAEYAFNSVSDSVVGIVCYNEEISENTPTASQGSGIIITSDGYVVTNSHVIGDSKTAYLIQVVTNDGVKHKAGVVGFDSRTDIAVLKMDNASGLKPAVFGDSDDIEIGEDIIVVGNPGGMSFKNSLTKGVISAVDRMASSKTVVKYLQTDAAINPGNSGGPAVNMYGQVIGIASAKIIDEKYEGMGFAIPSAAAKKIVDELMKNGYVSGRVKIGIMGTAVTSAEVNEYSVPQGILVRGIVEGGPCDNGEIKEDDIITKFDGKAITTFSEMYSELEKHKAGDKIKLTYYRDSDKSEHETEIILQEDKQ